MNQLLEKGENAVYDELRQIYCCKGAEFARPTLEKAWKEIARLYRALESSNQSDCPVCRGTDKYCKLCSGVSR